MHDRRRAVSSRALLAVVVAAAASLATSPTMPSASATWSEDLHFDDDLQVVARHILWTVAPTGTASLDVALELQATHEGMKAGGLVLTVIPDEERAAPGGVRLEPVHTGLELTEECSKGCTGGATVIVRQIVGGLGLTNEATVTATLRASGGSPDPDPPAQLTISSDAGQEFNGVPVTVLASASGTTRATAETRVASAGAILRLDCERLGPIDFPLLATLTLNAVVSSSAQVAVGTDWEVSAGSETWRSGDDGRPQKVDLALFCGPGSDGRVPIEFTLPYSPSTAPATSPPSAVPGFVEYTWTADVVIEAFDSRDLPADLAVFAEE